MATITLTLTDICEGGNHLTFSLTGARSASLNGSLDDMLAPITDEDAQTFMRCLAKLVRVGRTNNQARTTLQNGVTVTV
jgi:hypothetical protein